MFFLTFGSIGLFFLLPINIASSTEIDNIANEIVLQSQTEFDINTLWEKIDILQRDINNYQDTILSTLESDNTEVESTILVDSNTSKTKSFKGKLSLIPLQKDTLESLLPNLAIDVAKLYSKYGIFYVKIEKV